MTSPALAIELPDGSRAYRNPRTGEQAPSVTTIIAMINKPRLTGWAARLAAEYAVRNWTTLAELSSWGRTEAIRYEHDRVRNASAELGTAVHAAIEAYANGEPCEYSKEVSPFMTSFSKFIMEYRPEFLHSEVTLWNRSHGYAGTADAIISVRDHTYLVDFKTGKSLHDEVGLQLSALARGEFIITPDGTEKEMPVIDAIAAVHIRPRSWKFAPVNHFEENFQAFLAARKIHYWSTEIAPTVLKVTA